MPKIVRVEWNEKDQVGTAFFDNGSRLRFGVDYDGFRVSVFQDKDAALVVVPFLRNGVLIWPQKIAAGDVWISSVELAKAQGVAP